MNLRKSIGTLGLLTILGCSTGEGTLEEQKEPPRIVDVDLDDRSTYRRPEYGVFEGYEKGEGTITTRVKMIGNAMYFTETESNGNRFLHRQEEIEGVYTRAVYGDTTGEFTHAYYIFPRPGIVGRLTEDASKAAEIVYQLVVTTGHDPNKVMEEMTGIRGGVAPGK